MAVCAFSRWSTTALEEGTLRCVHPAYELRQPVAILPQLVVGLRVVRTRVGAELQAHLPGLTNYHLGFRRGTMALVALAMHP